MKKNITFEIMCNKLQKSDDYLLRAYIAEPLKERIKACLPIFQKLYSVKSKFNNLQVIATDFEDIFEDELQIPGVKENLSGLIKDSLDVMHVIDGEGKEHEGAAVYAAMEDDEQALFIAQVVFFCALSRYSLKSELRKGLPEFFTASSYTEYRDSLLTVISEENSKKQEKKESLKQELMNFCKTKKSTKR